MAAFDHPGEDRELVNCPRDVRTRASLLEEGATASSPGKMEALFQG
jgi:hypothetical protein